MVKPGAKREARCASRERRGLSERQACSLVGVSRRVFGYRGLGYLLTREGMVSNHEKLLRIYRQENLRVRRRGGRERALGTRAPLVLPDGPNRRWSLDFVSDTFASSRRFRILCLVDNYARMFGVGGRHIAARRTRPPGR